jgi:ferredoxin--NADP+ reductase
MVDGMGMCGACRVTVGGETKFACVDGPEFDAALVDFNELIQRQCVYLSQEKEAMCACEKSGGNKHA